MILVLVAIWVVSRDHWRVTNWALDRFAGIDRDGKVRKR